MSKLSQLLSLTSALSFISSSALAATGDHVHFSGCVRAGVEHGCLMVSSGGSTYNITAARPRPNVNTGISGDGIEAGGVSYCLQGVILRDISWQPNRLHCAPIRPAHRRHR